MIDNTHSANALRPRQHRPVGWALSLAAACTLIGCTRHGGMAPMAATAVAPLGSTSDTIWQQQEVNAEASDFVVYQHEFQEGSNVLNLAGQDHVKQIAFRLQQGETFPVVVERSMNSADPNSKFHYPVNANPDLDARRRDLIVKALVRMGIEDADDRVVVAPAVATGQRAFEAERAYRQTMQNSNGFGGGFGGFGGGIGGFGGGGFF